MPIATVSPATGETLKTFEALGPEEIEQRLARAHAAFLELRGTDFATRARPDAPGRRPAGRRAGRDRRAS